MYTGVNKLAVIQTILKCQRLALVSTKQSNSIMNEAIEAILKSAIVRGHNRTNL